MSNLLRAQWVRIGHAWFGYGCLALFVVLTLLVAMGSMNIRFMGQGYLDGYKEISPFWAYDEAFLMLGFVPIAAGFFVAELVAGDLAHGTAKNLLVGPRARLGYGGAVLLDSFVSSALLVAVGMLCVQGVAWARGISLEAVGLGAHLVWFVQATLCTGVVVMLVAAVAMATGSRMVAMVVALVLGLGVASTACAIVGEGLGCVMPAAGRYLPGGLAWWTAQLGGGPLGGWAWLGPVAAVGALGIAGTLLAARRRAMA